jgi:hypothetical protein
MIVWRQRLTWLETRHLAEVVLSNSHNAIVTKPIIL